MASICYAVALTFIYAGMELAPDMRWPETDTEVTAAMLLVSGMAAKLLGHIFLLFGGDR